MFCLTRTSKQQFNYDYRPLAGGFRFAGDVRLCGRCVTCPAGFGDGTVGKRVSVVVPIDIILLIIIATVLFQRNFLFIYFMITF